MQHPALPCVSWPRCDVAHSSSRSSPCLRRCSSPDRAAHDRRPGRRRRGARRSRRRGGCPHRRGRCRAGSFASSCRGPTGRASLLPPGRAVRGSRPRRRHRCRVGHRSSGEVGRAPAVGPADGAVPYVGDDGKRSPGAPIAGEPTPKRGGWRTSPRSSGRWPSPRTVDAYLALVDSGRPDADLGVVRVSLDGVRRRIERVMRPAGPAAGGIRHPAGRVHCDVRISADGRYLGRRGSLGAADVPRGSASCQTDVLELETGNLIDPGQGAGHRRRSPGADTPGAPLRADRPRSGQIGRAWSSVVPEYDPDRRSRPSGRPSRLVDGGPPSAGARSSRRKPRRPLRARGASTSCTSFPFSIECPDVGSDSYLLIGLSGEEGRGGRRTLERYLRSRSAAAIRSRCRFRRSAMTPPGPRAEIRGRGYNRGARAGRRASVHPSHVRPRIACSSTARSCSSPAS